MHLFLVSRKLGGGSSSCMSFVSSNLFGYARSVLSSDRQSNSFLRTMRNMQFSRLIRSRSNSSLQSIKVDKCHGYSRSSTVITKYLLFFPPLTHLPVLSGPPEFLLSSPPPKHFISIHRPTDQTTPPSPPFLASAPSPSSPPPPSSSAPPSS